MSKKMKKKLDKSLSTKKNLKILIVEDQASDILGPYMLANHLGYEVTLAFDGKEALSEINKNDYDFIILDWNMPHMSGRELLLKLKYKNIYSRKKKLKIILHTGSSFLFGSFAESEGFKIVDVWKKPFTAVDMLKRIKKLSEEN